MSVAHKYGAPRASVLRFRRITRENWRGNNVMVPGTGAVADHRARSVLFENETAMGELSPALQAQLDSILNSVRDEIIEDGMMNTIGRKLPELIAAHYREVLPSIAALTDSNRASAAVVSELLKEIGRIRDARSHGDRRWILEHALSSENPAARDGAAVGLAWLGDPGSAMYLRAAADTENIPQLKADLDEVFRLLRSSAILASGNTPRE